MKVRKLTISERKLGEGGFGTVYHGRAWFGGRGGSKQVAVKIFKWPMEVEQAEARFQLTVERLKHAGVNVPKTGLVQYYGILPNSQFPFPTRALVQVTELFERGGKSKMSNAVEQVFEKPVEHRELIKTLASLLNAGYIPAVDSIGHVRTREGAKFVVHDLDNYFIYPGHTDLKKGAAQDLDTTLTIWGKAMKMNKVNLANELKRQVTHKKAKEELEKVTAAPML